MCMFCLSRMICVCMVLVSLCLWNDLVWRKNCVVIGVLVSIGGGGGVS